MRNSTRPVSVRSTCTKTKDSEKTGMHSPSKKPDIKCLIKVTGTSCLSAPPRFHVEEFQETCARLLVELDAGMHGPVAV